MDQEPDNQSPAARLRDELLDAYFDSTADAVHGHGGVH